MLNVRQFRRFVIEPALEAMGMHSEWSVRLVLGTAMVESGLVYLTQHNDGPARGLFQMEPDTHDDIWVNYLAARPDHRGRLFDAFGVALMIDGRDELYTNLGYATAMCRLQYWRHAFTIPAYTDVEGLGALWKRFYNTPAGAGTVSKFVEAYVKHVEPAL